MWKRWFEALDTRSFEMHQRTADPWIPLRLAQDDTLNSSLVDRSSFTDDEKVYPFSQ